MSFRRAISKLYTGFRNHAPLPKKPCNSLLNSGSSKLSSAHEFGGYTWINGGCGAFYWVFLSGQAVIFMGIYSSPALAEDVSTESRSKADTSADARLQKIEDDSLISNEHTTKWRVFTDNGREYFMKGNIEQAEKFFLSALQEAKEGFGERDPHVASACNNLAELYRVTRAFNKAEPLYLEAVNVLEEYFGKDDVRVGAALHNLGQFYLAQRKFEEARTCYERALKLKRRMLGEDHMEYVDTMYHLGTVLYLQGNKKEAEDLIADSVHILEAIGQGESHLFFRRMQYLVQMYTKSNKFAEAEKLLQNILHRMELSKGWESLDTVLAAERLALVIQRAGRFREAEELLERCLDARKNIIPDVHIQNAANMLHIARVKILIASELTKTNTSEALTELGLAKNLLHGSIRVAQKVIDESIKKKGNKQPIRKGGKEVQSAALILLQSCNSLGSVEISQFETTNSKEKYDTKEAEAVLRQCMSNFKKFESEKSIADSREVKAEYLSCLRNLLDLISKVTPGQGGKLKEIRVEIQRVESGI